MTYKPCLMSYFSCVSSLRRIRVRLRFRCGIWFWDWATASGRCSSSPNQALVARLRFADTWSKIQMWPKEIKWYILLLVGRVSGPTPLKMPVPRLQIPESAVRAFVTSSVWAWANYLFKAYNRVVKGKGKMKPIDWQTDQSTKRSKYREDESQVGD